MLAAAAEDWIRTRRLHRAYLIGVPALIASMLLALFLASAAPPLWMEIARDFAPRLTSANAFAAAARQIA